MKKLTIVFFILFLMGCTGQSVKQDTGSYQNIHPLHDLLVRAMDSVYLMHTTTTFKSGEAKDSVEQEETMWGMAFVINEHQLLTCAHLVSIDSYDVRTPFGMLTMFIDSEDKTKEETWLVVDNEARILTKVIYKNVDRELDFAILEVVDEMPLPVYSIGDSDDFRMLDQVFMISNEGTGKNIKSGHIMQLDYMKPEMSDCNTDLVGLYLGIKSGASGSPVLLFRGNRLEVGGIVDRGDLRLSGYAVKINSIMNKYRAWQNEREWWGK